MKQLIFVLFILITINTFSQSNKENCERTIQNKLKILLTEDSLYYLTHEDFYSRTCVFKYDKKAITFNYDTSFSSDFRSKFGRFGKSHFITKNIAYRQHVVNNLKLKRMADKYNWSTFYKTYNSGVNWDVLVDLDVLDKEFFHSIDAFYCVDSNVVLLYGKQLKYTLRTKEFSPKIGEFKLDEFKDGCRIFPNGCLSSWCFNYAEFSTYMFITYDGGKNWKKLNNTFGKDFTDTHTFDVKTQLEFSCFKTGNKELNINEITHNNKTKQITISNNKNQKFYINY